MNLVKRCIYGISILSLASMNVQCKGEKKADAAETALEANATDSVSIAKSEYGKTEKGVQIDQYTLEKPKRYGSKYYHLWWYYFFFKSA